MPASPSLRYVTWTIAGAAAALLAAGAFNYKVDPYAVHGQPRVAGLNAKKPYAYTHAVWAKRTLAEAAHPRTLFLGNSRVGAGFDPTSAPLPEAVRPGFNFAIAGQWPIGDYENVVSTPGLDQVEYVVIGLDFNDFTNLRALRTKPTASSARGPGLARGVQATVSITAVLDSTLTVALQDRPFTNSMTELGVNTFAEHAGHVRLEGHFGLFHQRNIENIRAYLRRPRAVRRDDGQLSPAFTYLDWLLKWCLQRGARVDLVIYPYHAQLLEVLHHTGHWAPYEQWKRLLVERIGTRSDSVRLWDFSGYHEVASEPVPPKGDTRTAMRWYWEAGHFKSALGDLIVSRLHEVGARPAIGVRLTRDNVEEVIASIRGGREHWRRARPGEAAYVESLYRAVASPGS